MKEALIYRTNSMPVCHEFEVRRVPAARDPRGRGGNGIIHRYNLTGRSAGLSKNMKTVLARNVEMTAWEQ